MIFHVKLSPLLQLIHIINHNELDWWVNIEQDMLSFFVSSSLCSQGGENISHHVLGQRGVPRCGMVKIIVSDCCNLGNIFPP